MKKSITKKLETRGSREVFGQKMVTITDIHGVVVGYINPSYDNKLGFTGEVIILEMTHKGFGK